MIQKPKFYMAIMVLLALFIHTTTVLAIPSLPSSFYGVVKVNNANVPDGTMVEALINKMVVAQGYTQTYQGDSVYSLDVRGDDTDTAVHDGGIEGDIIYYTIGGLAADQTGTWHAGTNVELILSVISSSALNLPQPTPTAISTQTPIVFQQPADESKANPKKSSGEIFQNPAIIILAAIFVLFLIGLVLFLRKKINKRNI